MGFSMSASVGPYRISRGQELPVRVWGSGDDGGPDGLPVIVARGRVRMMHDGPEVVSIGVEGGTYRPTEDMWSPLQGEWVISAKWVPSVRRKGEE